MKLVQWISNDRVKEADQNNEIFYALKFTYDKQGKDGIGPLYSLCLPREDETLVLHDSTIAPNHLANNISYARTEGFNFSRIDGRMPYTIPELERLNGCTSVVLFEEMSFKEKKLFLETLVKEKGRISHRKY